MGGYAAGFNEINDQTRKDLTKAELIAFPMLALLLLFVFRGVVAAAIPLLLGVISIVGTLFVLRVMSASSTPPCSRSTSPPALSLGLAVDYALLLVSRYREEIGARRRRRARRTAARSRPPAAPRVFSGLTVAAAMAALIVMPQRFLYSMAVAGASVALLSALMAILVVPSLLALLGTRIDALSIRRGPAVSDASDGWYRLARGVMRRPVAVALGSTALLLAAAAPLLWTTLTGPSAEAVPPGKPSYDAYRYLDAHYPRDVTEAVTVTVDGGAGPRPAGGLAAPGRSGRRRRPRRPLHARLGRRSPSPTSPSPGPRSAASRRTRCTRSATSRRPVAATALVSGNTAGFIDQKQSLAENAPLVVAIICLTTLRPALPADRLGAAAAKDPADEHADPGRHPRHPRPRLPGGLARQPARLHRSGSDRGDQHRLPLRRPLRARDRLRGAGDGADQGALRRRRRATRRRSPTESAAPAA